MELTEIRVRKLGDSFLNGKKGENISKKTDLVAVIDLIFDDVFIVKSIRVLQKISSEGEKDFLVLYPEAKIQNRQGELVKVGSAFPINKTFALGIREQILAQLRDDGII